MDRDSSEDDSLIRQSVPTLDAVLGRRFRVLDDGFVRVVDYMGSDAAIVQAARVSYGAGTKQVQEDRGLIRYLMRHSHTTPFEMCELKLHVRVPMDCWRQWIRHRTANVNEYSTRYSLAIDAAQRTAASEWRAQASSNRQGSAGYLDVETGSRLSAAEARLQELAQQTYRGRIDANVAREQARKDLPLSTYTEAYWKIDLHNLMHFLRLRLDLHAQLEIRQYATTIAEEIVARWCPLAWEAFSEYRLGSLTLSKNETEMLVAIAAGRNDDATARARTLGWVAGGELKRHREREEFEAKLATLGLLPPWQPETGEGSPRG